MSRHDDGRHFENKCAAYTKDHGIYVASDGKLRDELYQKIQHIVSVLLDRLHRGISQTPFEDTSVYTGTTGISCLYLLLHDKFAMNDTARGQYLGVVSKFLGKPREKRCTFLCGDAGPVAVGAVLYSRMGQTAQAKEAVTRLEGMCSGVCKDPKLPDEVLYGRAGYLYSLLFVRHHLGPDSVSNDAIQKVVIAMIESGRRLSDKEKSRSPLMYEWYDEHYLGAAHGLAGIYSILLQVRLPDAQSLIDKYVRPSVDYMMTLMFDSGNSPPSLESRDKDKLIHWCHGAPGWVHMFALAYQTYEDEKYLQAAERCADVIWTRGLLKKGYGLCHGTGGNAYAFIVLHQLTQNPKYIYQAYKFAEWCFDYGSHGCRTPDRPYSMFEGMAGTIYFLVDLLDPTTASFPSLVLPKRRS